MLPYNWQYQDWPLFRFELEEAEGDLYAFTEKVGFVTGLLTGLPAQTELDTIVELLVAEAIKTSEIEGEYLNRKDVYSSVRNNLGLTGQPEPVHSRQAEGMGRLMVEVRKQYAAPLGEEDLFSWHRLLFPGRHDLRVGAFRRHEEPMQVVSGALGKERVHFEAPPSARVAQEMEGFIRWFNDTAPGGVRPIRQGPVRAALAHLYFESIHPFEDGNGRVGRAIAAKALAQGIGRPVLLSLSRTIEAHKRTYYEQLSAAQRTLEVTPWVHWFTGICLQAQTETEAGVAFTLQKARFFDQYRHHLNERQLLVVQRMFDEGPSGFHGGMNARKYVSLTKASKATATRDLQQLQELGAFQVLGGGRSTRYELVLPG